MTLLINILLIFALLFLGYRYTRKSPLKDFYWPAILLKILAGVALGLVYKLYYHGGDTFSFFAAAVQISEIGFASWENFVDIFFKNNYELLHGFSYTWIPSAVFVKLLSFLALLTGGNYWLSGIYMSIASFAGLWVWTTVLYRLTNNRTIAVVAGLFIPSIMFWSSGIMKETLAIPALALLSALHIRMYIGDKLRWTHLLVAILAFIILALTKYFLAAIFLATVVSISIIRKLLPKEGHWKLEIIALVLTFLVIAGLVSSLHPNLWPSRIAEVIFNNYQAYQNLGNPDGTITYSGLEPNLASVLINLPLATAVGLFLPLAPIKGSALSISAAIENWFIVFGTLSMLMGLIIPASRKNRLLIWGGLLFVIISAGLIALATPNLGTLARYKTGYLLILAPYLVAGIIATYRKFLRQS